MWWMAIAEKGKEKGKGAAKMAFGQKKKTPVYEPDQGLALSMNPHTEPDAEPDSDEDDFSDTARRKKRLSAEY